MQETKKVILDAGHGGADPGAVYQGRREKNDNLRIALAVGQILSENGVDVGYTRVQDVYQSPLQKAQMANNWDADYFVQKKARPGGWRQTSTPNFGSLAGMTLES